MIAPSPSRLNPKRRQKYKRIPEATELRQGFVEECYQKGGKPFVAAVEKYGVNERGDRLTLHPWHKELYELVGDVRLAEVLTTGASQIGKTLANTSFLCYCLVDGGLNTLWSYDQERSLNIQVPSNFRPVIKAWLKAKGIKVKLSEGTQNNTLYQVKGATAQFVYVSTSKLKEDNGSAAAGGIAVGVSRDILFKEERSQYPPGADAPLDRRLDAGRLPSRPIRQIGTPGSGLGIELEIETADYDFHPHAQCPKCKGEFNLTPMGCLLKEIKRKNNKPVYLSESGRPVNWHYHNPSEAIASAYFACPNCLTEIPKESRTLKTWFRCIKTGVNLRSFLDSLPSCYPERRIKAGICLSPLLRETEYNLASEMIREGMDTFNPPDWCQQRLGVASQSGATNVSLDMLREAIAFTPRLGKPDFILAGIDQGRGEDWLWICAYFLPENKSELSNPEVIEQTTRVVLFGGDVVRDAIPEKLQEYGVIYGIIDNEPDRADASDLCRVTCLEMADQKPGQKDAAVESTVNDGGIEYPCWHIRSEKFLKTVVVAFAMEKYCLPSDWDIWLGMMGNERSPLTHLSAPSYDPKSGKWKRGKNNIDDLYYAAMFCEVAFYLHLDGYQADVSFGFGGEDREIYGAIARY
jgi:hypothetical protein